MIVVPSASSEGVSSTSRVGFSAADVDEGIAHQGLTFPSTDGVSTCVGDLWLPSDPPRAVVEICHGMVEHLTCYRELAADLVAAGFACVGADVIGHGRSCPDPDARGIYDPHHGADSMIEDLEVLRQGVVALLPGVPVVLLGHSMGSFVVRDYAERHGSSIAGLIVLGTAWQQPAALAAGKALTSLIGTTRGWGYRSRMVDGLGCGGYNKAFEGTGDRTGYEWLSRDPVRPLAYAADADCGWMFSVSGYHVLFDLLTQAQDASLIRRVPADLPILILSGADDPVGAQGDGPARTFTSYKKAGVQDVTFDLFDGARHELLFETCRADVVAEILGWVAKLPEVSGR
jgi:alpha-beta hydrolase superfamily lysophospholipase